MGTTPQTPSSESPFVLLRRTLGYWLPCALAWYCGLVVFFPLFDQPLPPANTLYYPAWALFIIPFGLSLAFFFAYSACFAHPHAAKDGTQARDHKQTFVLWQVVGLLIAFAGLLLYTNFTSAWPPTWLTAALTAYTLAIGGYGFFLVYSYPEKRQSKYAALRYQLIWPVIISVAVPIYISLSITAFLSWEPLIPLGVLVAYAILSELFFQTRKPFLIFSFALITAAFAFAIWPVSKDYVQLLRGIQQHFASFLFAMAVAAYAAVFESWNVAATQARDFEEFHEMSPSANTTVQIAASCRYYYGSFAALVLSVFFAAILFPLTSRGTLLLILLFFHSALALFVWYSAAPQLQTVQSTAGSSTVVTRIAPPDFLAGRKWWVVKVIMGGVILIALSIDLLRGGKLNPTLLFAEPVTVTVFITLFNILGFVSNSDFPSLTIDELIHWYSSDKKRLLKHMFVLVVFGLGISFGITNNRGDVVAEGIAQRASNSFQLFNMYALATLLALVLCYVPNDKGTVMKSLWGKLLALALTFRLFSATAIAVAVTAIAALHGESMVSGLLRSLPFVLAFMGGVALNDYLDAEKDSLNRPYRPLPAGRLSPRMVLGMGVSSVAASVIAASAQARGPVDLLLYLGATLGVVCYNPVVKHAAVVKTFYTGVVSSLPFAYAVLTFLADGVFMLFPLAVALFVAGRELWMDIHDMEGDRMSGIVTIPMRLGIIRCAVLSSVLQVIAALLLLPVSSAVGDKHTILLGQIAVVLCLLLVVAWFVLPATHRRHVIYCCWLPMIAGVAIICR